MRAPQVRDRVYVVVVGHLDHGKSTLIGRLLHDTGSIPPSVLAAAHRAEQDGAIDFAHITDQLGEERSDGLTIDTTQAHLRLGERDVVLIDAPGHREFLGNMLTGACEADEALLVIDVEDGVREQTLRHMEVLKLIGVQRVAAIVNKIDRADFSEDAFNRVGADVERFARTLGVALPFTVPISATSGDGVASPSEKMPWYSGPTVIGVLESLAAPSRSELPLRFVTQGRFRVGGRNLLMGRVASGVLRKGSELLCLPKGGSVTVREIIRYPAAVEAAEEGDCVAIVCDAGPDVDRGSVLSEPTRQPACTQEFSARVLWLGEVDLLPGARLTVRCATQSVPGAVARIGAEIRADESREGGGSLSYADIGEISIQTRHPLVIDDFSQARPLGRITLEEDGHVRAAGIVIQV